MNVLIFRTNVTNKTDFNKIQNILSGMPDVHDCTIDLEDCDKVLRVISNKQTADNVKNMLNDIGFYCEELND